MSSKVLRTFTVILMATLAMPACSEFLKDSRSENKKNEGKIIQFEANEECLKQLPEALNLFFADEDASKTLDPSVDCIKKALDKFQKYARGEQQDSYTAKELQHFLNRYLLKNNQISDAFLAEVMKLKVVVVGGDRAALTKKEFVGIYSYLDLIKDQGKYLSGSFKLLLFNKEKKAEKVPDLGTKILDSEGKVLQVLTALLDKSQIVSARYEFEDLKSFIFELDQFVGESEALKAIIKWLPVVETAKLLFIGENSKLISHKEWKASLNWLNSAYFFALKYFYIISDLKFTTPAQWEIMLPWTDQIFDLIQSSPVMREKSLLQAQHIDRLIDGVWGLKLFETTIGADLMKRTYRKALVHMIEGQPAGKGNAMAVNGLKIDHLKIIRQEYNIWRLSQMSINQAFTLRQDLNATTFVTELERFNVGKAIATYKTDPLEKDTLYRSWGDWITLARHKRPVVLNQKGKVTLAYNLQIAPVYFESMSMTNATRSITRLTLRGYGSHRNQHLHESSISEQRLIHLEEDFREFGRAIGLLDARQPSPAARTFKEGNFFTFDGNGDKWLTYNETFQLVNVLFSGGSNIVGEILKDLGTKGCLLNEVDIFGKPIALEACFKVNFRKESAKYFDNMLWMTKMIQEFSPSEYEEFYVALMKLSRLPETAASKIEYAEIRTAATILQYVESLFIIYDLNRDQILSEEEVERAFPRFKQFILEMAESDSLTEDIFMFLIYNGRAPEGVTEVLMFKAKRLMGLGDVNKLQLLKVLSVLKDAPVLVN